MTHSIIVAVETDDKHIDAADRETLVNEIRSNLEYDMTTFGIVSVDVRSVPYSYRTQVQGSNEQ